MRRWLLIIGALVPVQSWAQLDNLVHARSAADLAKIRHARRSESILNYACQIQLEERAVPVACYQLRQKNKELDGACKIANLGATTLADLYRLSREASLSQSCHRRVEEHFEIRRYQSADRDSSDSYTAASNGPNLELGGAHENSESHENRRERLDGPISAQ